MNADDQKRRAAEAALALLPDEGVIGLGTGSTTRFFIEAVGELVRAGRKLVGVPTSAQSRVQAEACGIPLLDDAGPWSVELCVDGADEVSDALDLIKGGGGAHTREKIVNRSARRNAVIVDDSKLSRLLGEKRQLPIEVVPFGHRSTAALLAAFGKASLREVSGRPFVTDSGNLIYDVQTGPITAPLELERALHAVPGVVETGLFCARADVVIIASPTGVREVRRSA